MTDKEPTTTALQLLLKSLRGSASQAQLPVILAAARRVRDAAGKKSPYAHRYLERAIRELEAATTKDDIQKRWITLRRAAHAAKAALTEKGPALGAEMAFLVREARDDVSKDGPQAEEVRMHLEKNLARQVELITNLVKPNLREWKAKNKRRDGSR
jgi:hypothetical protein